MDNRGQQMEFCQKELKKINKQLPAAVYLPFVSESARNYAVLHIVTEEAKIFRTKERCPLMLLIECYRPTEIALEKVPELLKIPRRATQLAPPEFRPTNMMSAEKGLVENDEIHDFFDYRGSSRAYKTGGLTMYHSANVGTFDGIQREPLLTISSDAATPQKQTKERSTSYRKESFDDLFGKEPPRRRTTDKSQKTQTKEDKKLQKEQEKRTKVFNDVKKLSNKEA